MNQVRFPDIPIAGLGAPVPAPRWPLFTLGFRPFFLLGALWSVAAMSLWALKLAGAPLEFAWDGLTWHRHEMIFGFGAAVVAGFLLTAVRNWTGRPTASGKALAALTASWLAARLASAVPQGWVAVAAGDALFLLGLTVAVARPLIAAGDQQNYRIAALVALLAMAGIADHALRFAGRTPAAAMATSVALWALLLLLVTIAGRLVPFFTRRAIAGAGTVTRPIVEHAAFWLTTTTALIDVAALPRTVAAVAACGAACAHGLRLAGWWDVRVVRQPLLWVLFAGYAWLTTGFALLAAATFAWIPRAVAIHALAAGGLGVFVIGMMPRVTMGHTGRLLRAGPAFIYAGLAVLLAAAVRVVIAAFVPHVHVLLAAAVLWSIGFGIFVVAFGPALWRPRVDGRPD